MQPPTLALVLLLTFAVFFAQTQSARILVSQPFGSRSHQNTFIPLIGALSERGHQITYITNYGPYEFNENVKQIILPGTFIHYFKPIQRKFGLLINMFVLWCQN